MTHSFDWQAAKNEVLRRLDILEEVKAAGLEITDSTPNANGWVTARAFDREDNNPSAGVNVGDCDMRGMYHDFGRDDDTSLSLGSMD